MSSIDNDNTTLPNDGSSRPRRGSITAQTFTSLFNRSSSTTGAPTNPFPGPITAATQDQKRRMSISSLGLSGTSPTQASPFPFANRRSSVSTAGSESVDENAIEDDDGPGRSNPTSPFARRMSFGAVALRNARVGNGSPGTTGDGVFNWSEQLRSRAESTVSQTHRPSFSTSPPTRLPTQPNHERAKSVSEMPAPPTTTIPPAQRPAPAPARKQPDAFQERILKGDFYMD